MRKMIARLVLAMCAALSLKLLVESCAQSKKNAKKAALPPDDESEGTGKSSFSPIGIAKACVLKRMMNRED